MDVYVLISVLITWHLLRRSDGACTWPSPFVQSTWHDSTRGDLTFALSIMNGWDFTIEGITVDRWQCLSTSTFDTDGNLMMLTTETFQLFSVQYYAYMCLKMTKVTDNSYRYYQSHTVQGSAGNERIFAYPVNTLTDPTTICDDANGAAGPEYQLLIKSGGEMAAKVTCPYSFLGQHDYTVTDSGGVTTCQTGTTTWDLCTDNTQMTFSCGQPSYSAANTVWCVDSVYTGENNVVMMYNGYDAANVIDNVDIFRFACFVISGDGSGASVTPSHCKAGQTPTTIPTDVAGDTVGALLTVVSTIATCPSCPLLDHPPRGTVTIVTNDVVTTASYVCDATYTLSGNANRDCQSDDTWTSSEPACNCAIPPTPTNGAVLTSADGSVSTYTCRQGYTLDGLATRNCVLATGTWEDVDPACALCETLVPPAGTTISLGTEGLATNAAVTCLAGYTLSGSSSITCQTDGSWDPPLPTCVTCDPLSNPFSGSVQVTSDGAMSTARYSCVSGYNLLGVSQVTCDTAGVWSQPPPTCVCQTPSSPDSGEVTADGATATYECVLGFTLSGDSSRTCQNDGSGWSGDNPTCTRCRTLAVPNGGIIDYSTDGTSTTAKYTCTAGYTLDGTNQLTCQMDGIWNIVPPICAKCDILNNPSSGTVVVSSSGTTSSAIYTCLSGYELNGATIRLCRTDGSWELTAPTCTCKQPSTITNGHMSADGETALYTCEMGYSLFGAATRTCQPDGSGWTDTDPSCSLCESLAERPGATIPLTTDGLNTAAAFICDTGYTLNGISHITCDSMGQWDFTDTTCASCRELVAPSSGTVTVSTTGIVTSAAFTCLPGYYINGPALLTCSSEGSWDNTEPTCKCNFPATPSNGRVSVSDTDVGSFATYICSNGYTLNGLSSRLCSSNATGWEDDNPICARCETIVMSTNGQFSLATTGIQTLATFLCVVGTTLGGEAVLSCLPNGTWNAAIPECVTCDPLSNPFSGSVQVTSDGAMSTARYSCVSGYNLLGVSQVTCDTAGVWSQPPPTCVCQTPSSPDSGEVTADGATATYECVLGFTLSGDSSRTCQNDGSGWSGDNPTCTRCRTLAVPNGGIIDYSTDGTSTTAKYTCTAGYTLDGTNQLTCQMDGIWNIVPPICACKQPSTITNGHMSADGETALYTCEMGYSLFGAATRTCQPDGSGWTDTDPSCSLCESLAERPGATIPLTTDGLNTAAAFICDTGYTLNGISHITCDSMGQWDFTDTTCASCRELVAPSSGTVTVSTTGIVTSAAFTCLPGYYINGPALLTCSSEGSWDNTEPTCKCNFPATPSNGRVSVSDTDVGSFATYICSNGYTLNGLSSRLCSSNATGWEDDNPICARCETIVMSTNGQFSLATTGIQTLATFLCVVGTTLGGEAVLSCLPNGTWNAAIPECVPCPSFDDFVNGGVSLTSSGTVTRAMFTCEVSYILDGASELTCLTNGSWNLPTPVCQCDIPTAPDDGFMNMTADLTTMFFYCNDGFDLIGSSVMVCRDDGSGWNASQPICQPETPPSESSPIKMWAFITVAAILVFAVAMVALLLCVYIRARSRLGKISVDMRDKIRNNAELDGEGTPGVPEKETPSTDDEVIAITSETTTLSRPSSRKRRNSGDTVKSQSSRKSVRLPEQGQPPIGHELIITERKRKNFNELQLTIDRKYPPRRLSPLDKQIHEVGIDRVRTPDLLSYVPFNYIHPVFTYEPSTPSVSEAGSRQQSRAPSGHPSIRSKKTTSDLYDE